MVAKEDGLITATVTSNSEVTVVRSDELLYRRILPGMTRSEGAVFRPVSAAFYDREQHPSVDREELCRDLGGPAWTQELDQNGVFEFTAADARISKAKFKDNKGTVDLMHKTDILHRPKKDSPEERDNPAHSEIHTIPECSREFFRKIAIQLAGMAGNLVILPKDVRGS